ncbi:MAG: nucleotidyltransferase domain-containing protein [Oscillospiraceae bacterium]|nr:nucleotidyltransferase domain-containing protein [Oscillospiraceae bacterium]
MFTIQEIVERLVPVFEANGIKTAILFGSYAKGTATDLSDVDLVIVTAERPRGLRAIGIKSRIGDALPIPVDVFFQFELIPDGRADKEVRETGVIIYEAA